MNSKTFFRTVSAVVCSSVAAWAAPAAAQVSAFPQGSGPAAIDGYTLPRTVVTATVVVEREVILRGTYAKYAAQYLGISGAAMSDKQNYRIIDASLGYYEEPDPAQTYALNRSVDLQSRAFHWLSVGQPQQPLVADAKFQDAAMGNNNPFTDVSLNPLYGATVERSGLADGESFGELPVNRTSMVEKSTEQLAADAANAIFTLRKRRFDLVTGEMGEHVFGAGLPAALKEIDRLEAEYLSLFIGKRYTQRIVRTYSVLPSDKGTAIVCRFSPTKGVVPDTDLSGRPLVIEMTAEGAGTAGNAARGTVGNAKKGSANLPYRIPSVQIVKLVDGTEELARERIPVFQMGTFASAQVVY
ncbi:DUF4831 family protein [uncultured Rikenella sp.]|mgnify:CR=1 FL=1|uniref:DUF4831 family protein n=1 Tax=uncultured Rikenella sp. TaxID=368003 RepID=UPI0025D6F5C6|nr:DUF4831 family protein [uncultured Rikenella sp.]